MKVRCDFGLSECSPVTVPDDFKPSSLQVSVVAYDHPAGIPARIVGGCHTAWLLAKCGSDDHKLPVVLRIIDPSPIADFCNGWIGGCEKKESRAISLMLDFISNTKPQGCYPVEIIVDKSEPVGSEMLEVLDQLSQDILSINDPKVKSVVDSLRQSGYRHGGATGERNALLYAAAHTFSWCDMYHRLIWKRKLQPNTLNVNVMSVAERRFAVIRKGLTTMRPELVMSDTCSLDSYVEGPPCYIRLDGELTYDESVALGYEDSCLHYKSQRNRSRNHKMASENFRLVCNPNRSEIVC